MDCTDDFNDASLRAADAVLSTMIELSSSR